MDTQTKIQNKEIEIANLKHQLEQARHDLDELENIRRDERVVEFNDKHGTELTIGMHLPITPDIQTHTMMNDGRTAFMVGYDMEIRSIYDDEIQISRVSSTSHLSTWTITIPAQLVLAALKD